MAFQSKVRCTRYGHRPVLRLLAYAFRDDSRRNRGDTVACQSSTGPCLGVGFQSIDLASTVRSTLLAWSVVAGPPLGTARPADCGDIRQALGGIMVRLPARRSRSFHHRLFFSKRHLEIESDQLMATTP